MTVWKKEILIVILIILVAIPVSFIYDSFNGNPIGQYMAKQKIITPSPPAIPLTPTPGYFKMTGFFILYLEPRDKQLMQPIQSAESWRRNVYASKPGHYHLLQRNYFINSL